MRELSQSDGGGFLGDFWILGQLEVSIQEAWGEQGQQRCHPPAGTNQGSRRFWPHKQNLLLGCTEGSLTLRKRGFGPRPSPGAGQPAELVGFASRKAELLLGS